MDYRCLNDLTVKDSHPPPVIDDVLARLNGNKYFTALDQTGAYHVVPIKPVDREKTAFQTPEGLFQFCRMAFGLCNAPATFSRLVQQVLEDIPHEVALAYLDDTLLGSIYRWGAKPWHLPHLCIPDALKRALTTAEHEWGHQGRQSTIHRLNRRYYFPGLHKEVEMVIWSCHVCQRKAQHQNPQRHKLVSLKEGYPFEKIFHDFVGPFPESRRGNTHLLTVKDGFTRWVEAFSTQTTTAEEVVRLLETNLFSRFGHPQQIDSNQGSQFMLGLLHEVCQQRGGGGG